MVCRFVSPCARLVRASASVMAPFRWLHSRCMRRQFLRSYCEPPRDRGRSSSTSARLGWGWHPAQGGPGHFGPCPPGVILSALSTSSSQSAHVRSSALTRLTSSRLRCPLALRTCAATATPVRYTRCMYLELLPRLSAVLISECWSQPVFPGSQPICLPCYSRPRSVAQRVSHDIIADGLEYSLVHSGHSYVSASVRSAGTGKMDAA